MTTEVVVFHNVARAGGRRVSLGGYRPGQSLVPVFRYEVPAGLDPFQVAESAYATFNGAPDLNDDQQKLSRTYYARQLRSLPIGDVVRTGTIDLVGSCIGFAETTVALNQQRITEHEPVPLAES